MKLTKYKHACFALEHDDAVVIVDPGEWSEDLIIPENVVAIAITHEHFDHCNPERIQAIVKKNPGVTIYAHADVVSKLPDLPTQSVSAGEVVTIGPFTLEFLGGEHAIIHPTFDKIANLGVLINGTVYYPGDSFVRPSVSVKVLALPVTAPWLKISEVIDFLVTTKPEIAFPTHDAIASAEGKNLVDGTLAKVAEPHGIAYQRIIGSTEV